ncbi:MAG TPA: four helix bundle protein [Chitinophagaceae bacterium]|nr:four helix bundle protein [Chitinophagaceae bacterium]HPH32509.1 four helix bundle protein [Chitinophagaceae bacterium]HPN60442.1 four helix bundle protein [Chitinophagaceae bacterium]
MENRVKKYDLEDRLVDFACICLEVCDLLPPTRAGQNLEYQLSKSSTAAALNYGEAQAAESTADFIHKMKVVLKEIRESRVNLKIICRKPVIVNEKTDSCLNEANELMAIFIKSINTAKKNLHPSKTK